MDPPPPPRACMSAERRGLYVLKTSFRFHWFLGAASTQARGCSLALGAPSPGGYSGYFNLYFRFERGKQS